MRHSNGKYGLHGFLKKRISRAVLALSVSLASMGTMAQQAADPHAFPAAKDADKFWNYFNDYCTDCHNFDDYYGGIDFTASLPSDVPKDPALFEKVLVKLRGRMMPPPNRVRPDENRTDAFIGWLEEYLDEAGATRDPVRHIPIHRLNRKEYANAIHDLFDLDIEAKALLPEDDQADGFDNIAEALRVSPAFINQYVSAARNIAERVVGDPTPNTGSTTYKPELPLPIRARGGGPQQLHIDGLPLGTRGGMLITHDFPVDGEYAINVGDFNLYAWMFNIEFENKMIVTVDGEKVYETIIGGDKDRVALDLDQGPPMDDINSRTKNIRFTTTAGPHKVGVTFVRRSFAESDDRLEPFIPGTLQDRIISIPSVEIRGPYNPGQMSQTPTREKLFSCYPQSASEARPCAEQIISRIAMRAYRRPVTDADLKPLMEFYDKGQDKGGFEEGMRQALARTLASPNFLYRVEKPSGNRDKDGTYAISSLDLASRLSFFLWSSIPDDELLQAASNDSLKDPKVLEAEVRRMLADPRSEQLAENFAYQWLKLSKLDEINPDESIFPYASGAGDLRDDFKKEIALFVDSVFRDDDSIMRLLDADYSFLNERLALHYGIENVKGNRFRKVKLDDPTRWGLLGKGGVLMTTAYPNRTSPVLRGAWILEVIMGTPPPVPPPNVPQLKENETGKKATTVRERLEQHRENPTCAACHTVMDPLGFALDNFDAVGHWRDIDRFTGDPMDPTGVMPNGKLVNGPLELRKALMSRPNLFAQSLTVKLLTYALGRTLTPYDMPTVRHIVHEAAKDDYKFSSIVLGIVNTDLFQDNRVPEEVSSVNDADTVALNESGSTTAR